MKTCPVCHARAFDDAEVCFGCLHRFAAAEPNTSCAAMPKSGSIRGASPAAAGGASAAEGAASAMAAAETAPSTSAAAAASSAIPASPAFARASGSASGRTGLSAMPPAARALGLASPASPQPSMTGDALPVFPANAVSPDRLAVCSGDAVGVARDVSEGAFARVDSAKGSETAVSRVSMMSPEMSASALEGASAKAIFPADVPGGGSAPSEASRASADSPSSGAAPAPAVSSTSASGAAPQASSSAPSSGRGLAVPEAPSTSDSPSVLPSASPASSALAGAGASELSALILGLMEQLRGGAALRSGPCPFAKEAEASPADAEAPAPQVSAASGGGLRLPAKGCADGAEWVVRFEFPEGAIIEGGLDGNVEKDGARGLSLILKTGGVDAGRAFAATGSRVAAALEDERGRACASGVRASPRASDGACRLAARGAHAREALVSGCEPVAAKEAS